jgi:ferredoxin
MGATLILILGGLSLAGAILLTGAGLAVLARHRRAASPAPITIILEGREYPAEPGVILNTLWEHLPDAACQSGECGGCKVRLLEGSVDWTREPTANINRRTHILACSCQARTPLKCALE